MLIVIGLGIFIVANFLYIHGLNPFFLVVLILLVVGFLLFAVLQVEVDRKNISIRFGVGLIRKQFPIEEIESYEVVRNPWYYGWGIRKTPHGWLYNVSGLSAVEIRMKDGRNYRIGTNDPGGLSRALKQVVHGG
ncbi:MAG: hypothetical protein RIG61_02315 [Deltaproteobacteria bacterium]